MNIGHDPEQHAAYVGSWIKLLQDTPFEIHAAAADAEKIFNYLTGLEQKRNIVTSVQPTSENQLPTPGKMSEYLTIGDKIEYNNTVFKVHGHLKQGRLRIEDLGTGNNFILSKSDNLYNSLLQAKQYPVREAQSAVSPAISNYQQTEPSTLHVARR